jgi:hypothetical protein
VKTALIRDCVTVEEDGLPLNAEARPMFFAQPICMRRRNQEQHQ